MPIVLDGKIVADDLALSLRDRCNVLKEKGINPKLIIFTNTDDASKVYVRNKVRRCEQIGIEAVTYPIAYWTDFVKAIHDGHDYTVTPFILQEPSELTKEEDDTMVNNNYLTDVDGFSIFNMGSLLKNENFGFEACTPKGIMTLLHRYGVTISGKKAVVIGRSNIVGKPMAVMMLNEDATVTICHSKTPKYMLDEEVMSADIIVSAVGKPNMLSGYREDVYERNFKKKILVDVGMNRDNDGKLCGDFCREAIENCFAYTPVPGGVGPMTVISLCQNVIDYYEFYGNRNPKTLKEIN